MGSSGATPGGTSTPGLNLAWTAVKTANYSPAAGEAVPCNTSGGIFTVTLPTAPADKTTVAVKLIAAGNNLTIATGGSDVFEIAGGATSMTLSLLDQTVVLQYKATGAIWYVVTDPLPLAQLDARYRLASAALVPPIDGKVAAAGTIAFGTGVTGDANDRFTVKGDGTITWQAADATGGVTLSRSAAGTMTGTGIWKLTQVNVNTALNNCDLNAASIATAAFMRVDGSNGSGYVQYASQASDPAAPAAGLARAFSRTNGGGKMEFGVRFPTGAIQILATEP